MDDPKQLALIFSILYISMETIKVLVVWITKNFKKSEATGDEKKLLTQEEREWLKSLYDWHNKENDGKKIWYVPKNLEPTQQEILNTCMLINNSQNKMCDNQEKIAKILGNFSHDMTEVKKDIESISNDVREIKIKSE